MAPRRSARSRAAGANDADNNNTNNNKTKGEEGGAREPPKGRKQGQRGSAGAGKKRKSTRENRDDADDDAPASNGHSIGECLVNVGVARADLEACDSLDDEFQTIKRSYFKKILEEHPDKGGDPEKFRRTRTSFEVLRDLKGRGHLHSFVPHLSDGADAYYDQVYGSYEQEGAVPSYEYYEEAAQEVTPGYKVELAKSARSQCTTCKRKSSSGARKAVPAPSLVDASAAAPLLETASSDPLTARSGGDDAIVEAPVPQRRGKKSRTDAAGSSVALATAASSTSIAPATFKAPAAFIGKDAIRVGSLDDRSGSYGRWFHLGCWRVPYRIWAGLQSSGDREQVLLDLLHMDQVLLTGLASLPPDGQQAFVDHVMDQSHWARKTAASKPPPPPPPPVRSSLPPDENRAAGGGNDKAGSQKRPPRDSKEMKKEVAPHEGTAAGSFPTAASSAAEAVVSSTATAMVARSANAKAKFVIPRPGLNGAKADCLAGKTFVLTGVYPEVGGGAGLNQGKDKVKSMIQAFGGRVTSAVSGKTSYVVVGKMPGQSKVGSARARGVPLVDLGALVNLVYGTVEKLEDAPQPAIQSFSAGYMGRAQIGN
jgi:BRCA1 C Terminus (BRCT) domain